MRTKALAVIASSLLLIALSIAIDELGCFLNSCVHDDVSSRVQIFMVPMLMFYLLLSWLTVFPAIIALSKRVPKFIASLVVSLMTGILVAYLFHRPDIDGAFIHTAISLLPWLVIPWFVSGWVAAIMWPNPSFKRDCRKSAAAP